MNVLDDVCVVQVDAAVEAVRYTDTLLWDTQVRDAAVQSLWCGVRCVVHCVALVWWDVMVLYVIMCVICCNGACYGALTTVVMVVMVVMCRVRCKQRSSQGARLPTSHCPLPWSW